MMLALPAAPPTVVPATPTASSSYQAAPITAFHEHPAQMRTLYDLEEMATLTLQVYGRDLDQWQPIVATPRPDGEGYYILSGHRRRMARLFADALLLWRSETAVDEAESVTLEEVCEFLTVVVQTYEFLDVGAEALAAENPERSLPFVLFEGDEKAQILALQRANYGIATPDRLGIAHSFQQALEAGAMIAEIARNAGQPASYVSQHLALNQVPQELAEQVADGQLPLSVAVAVAAVTSTDKRHGLALYILSCAPDYPTAAVIQQVARTLKRWAGPQLPLEFASQAARNLARCLVRLWQQVVAAYPAQAWAIACAFMTQGAPYDQPWTDHRTTYHWLARLGGERYVGEAGEIHWALVTEELLSEVHCEQCPIAQLPTPPLQSDLARGTADVVGRPCRTPAGAAVTRCLNGFAPQDPFLVQVPWAWADHPGVVRQGSRYVAASFAALEQAWQAQAAAEAAEAADDCPLEESANSTATTVTGSWGADSAPQPPRSPIQRMRQQIADFVQRHATMDTDHPYATPCNRCQHQLTHSPTQNPAVPHCAWASRLRNVSFHALIATEGPERRPIPVCRQFAPQDRWRDLIPHQGPTSALPAGTTRPWLHQQLLALVADASAASRGQEPFEWLTGRPMNATERSDEWFATQLNEQIGELSDAQLWQLFLWATAEWQRHKRSHRAFLLPMAGGQLIALQAVVWPTTPAPARTDDLPSPSLDP
ncbi:MAG: hypothetical protein KDD73_11550 [Anaerolineales bacterium]|nr:hypothetical protein [Anaerolineales bacterium]